MPAPYVLRSSLNKSSPSFAVTTLYRLLLDGSDCNAESAFVNLPTKFSALLLGLAGSATCLTDLPCFSDFGLWLVLFAPVTDGGSLNVGALNAFILRFTSAVSLPFLTGSSAKIESNEAI